MPRLPGSLLLAAVLPACTGSALPEATPDASAPPSPSASAEATTSDASGDAAAASLDAAIETQARIYSKRRHVWIQPTPSARSPWIGFLGLGDAVAIREPKPVRGDGCAAFYAIEPRGWVCLDARTTLDPADAEYAAIRKLAPLKDGPWPLEYGESRETPRYWSVPSRAQQRAREWRLDDHLASVARMRAGELDAEQTPRMLRGVDAAEAGIGLDDAWARAPVVHEYRTQIKAGSTISWANAFDAEGRTWLITADLALVPKDKVAPFPHVDFQGVALDERVKLPIAYTRFRPRTAYERSAQGEFSPASEPWPRLERLGLTGEQALFGGKTLLQTLDRGRWIDRKDATILRGLSYTPWGEPVQGADGTGPRIVHRPPPPASSRGTWIEVSVHGGWMIAYERTRPVFATLVSPGRGRTIRGGEDEEVESATPPGVFNIQGKYRTSTMAVTEIVHFDVTFAMPFSGTIALHSAYWHNRWGEKASMGCVNLSPMDAFWLFRWAEPELPEGWHGVSVNDGSGYATTVVVHG